MTGGAGGGMSTGGAGGAIGGAGSPTGGASLELPSTGGASTGGASSCGSSTGGTSAGGAGGATSTGGGAGAGAGGFDAVGLTVDGLLGAAALGFTGAGLVGVGLAEDEAVVLGEGVAAAVVLGPGLVPVDAGGVGGPRMKVEPGGDDEAAVVSTVPLVLEWQPCRANARTVRAATASAAGRGVLMVVGSSWMRRVGRLGDYMRGAGRSLTGCGSGEVVKTAPRWPSRCRRRSRWRRFRRR